MSTVQHSTLTGSSLHEPKGVAAAASNKVYVSDGAGSGSWTTVPVAALASAANSFGAQLYHVSEHQTSGVASSTNPTPGGWRTVALNTEVTKEPSSVSLSGNVLSLPAGTYWANASFSLNNAGGVVDQLRLQNTSDASTLVSGLVEHSSGSGNLSLSGRFILAGTKNVELQIQVGGGGGGAAQSGGYGTEVYTNLMLWKIV